MRAVARLVALGRAGLPESCSPAASACSGFAFLPCGLPCAGAWPFCFSSFCFSSFAILCFYLSHGFGFAPVREELTCSDPSTRPCGLAQDERSRLRRLENALIFPAYSRNSCTPA